MKVLVINAGSSSLKYQLMDPATREVFAKGLCERIGIDGRLTHKVPAKDAKYEFEIPMPTHSEAIQAVLDALLDAGHGVIKSASEIDAVGHRVVHGGEKFASSVRITDEVMAALEECIPLAPLHNPANITGIKACEKVMPGVPMVGVFDTAFHQTITARQSYIYSCPMSSGERDKVRRYGFRHLPPRMSPPAAAMLGIGPLRVKIILHCHLGNGSSYWPPWMAARAWTPPWAPPGRRSWAPRKKRSGQPSGYLMGKHGYDMKEMMTILNKKSGVLGISGVSSDFRDLENAAKEGNQRAELALEAFQYSVKKLVGAYAAAMGGVDAIVFTAGVGENDAATRMAVASGLEFMGVKMDAEANNVRGKETVISSADSKVKVLLIPTDEELMIAMDTAEIVGK